jgi:transposase
MQPREQGGIPLETVRVARTAFPKGSLAIRVRDELGVLFTDEQFADLFPTRGKPAWSPGRLALVLVLQFVEGLTDRQVAEAVRARIDFKYALGLELTDPGFDYSVLSEFRDRLVEVDAGRRVLDGDLRTAMRYVHLQAGAPSSRSLEAGAPRGHLPHTTLDRLLNTREKPRLPSVELLDAFLVGCHIPARRRKGWEAARERLVGADATLSARERARLARSTSYGAYHDADWDNTHHQEQERRFWKLRKGNRNRPHPSDFGLPDDAVEEYTDQWAIEYEVPPWGWTPGNWDM